MASHTPISDRHHTEGDKWDGLIINQSTMVLTQNLYV
jgi:hypothetical protein